MMLSGRARLAGVIGWPVGHSLSPRLHGYWLDRYRIDGAYVPLAVRPEHTAGALQALATLGFAGCNVTVPHKEAALAAVDAADAAARRIGAVNTIVVDRDGRLHGSNTDGFGFLENVRFEAPHWHAGDGPAVVLGAGGSSRSVCVALLDARVPEVRLINRTYPRAQRLAAQIGGAIRPLPWAERAEALADAMLLVNTTTLGMTDQPALDIDLAALPTAAVVGDIVYVPLETGLLKAARARGNAVVDGLGMLIHQARPGFAAWFGREPEVTDELRRFLLAALAP
jgi:shikimate dehydrogenase